MSVLVTTVDGYHIFTSSGKHLTSLEGHRVESFTPGPDGTWFAIVDSHEIWQHGTDGTWTPLTKSDANLTAIVAVDDTVFAGTSDARVLRVSGIGVRRAAPCVRHRRRARVLARGRHPAAGALDDRDVRRWRAARQRPRRRDPALGRRWRDLDTDASRSTTTSTRSSRTRHAPRSWWRRRRSACAAAPTAGRRGRARPTAWRCRTRVGSPSWATTSWSRSPTAPGASGRRSTVRRSTAVRSRR